MYSYREIRRIGVSRFARLSPTEFPTVERGTQERRWNARVFRAFHGTGREKEDEE